MTKKKLALSTETLRTLSMDELAIAAGGGSAMKAQKLRHLAQLEGPRERFATLIAPHHFSRLIDD